MTKCSEDYRAEIDATDETKWGELLREFDDASIRQSWSYGRAMWNEKNMSYVILKKGGEVVSMAQLRITKFPIIKRGIATVLWGPMWRLRSKDPDLMNLECMVRVLREEYVIRRRLQLRIYPNIYENDIYADRVRLIFRNAGFGWKESLYRTLVMDISPSLTEFRKGLVPRWRTDLNRSENNNLAVLEGTGVDLYDSFKMIYDEMHERKKFLSFVDPDMYRTLQNDLHNDFKMKILLCQYQGQVIAAAITSAIGDTGLAILWATSKMGREMKGAYLLQWRTIETLKACGCLRYDIGGIDPNENPGSYRFKVGLGGKWSVDVKLLGKFEACESLLSGTLVKVGDTVKDNFSRLRWLLNKGARWSQKTASEVREN